MTRPTTVAVLVLLAVSVSGVPQQPAPSPAGKAARAALSFGPTYDEIVVETQLAVRPKVGGAGLSLRSGRAKAKPVFFRPNATSSAAALASGAEVRHITPLASLASPTTPRDGIAFAARVETAENPLAVERARKAQEAAAAASRARRQSSFSSYSFQSSSSSGSGPSGPKGAAPAPAPEPLVGQSSSRSTHSFRSGSSSGHSEHSGRTGVAPPHAGHAPEPPPPTAPGGVHTSTKSSSSRTYTRQLADGRTVTVTETDDIQSSLGPEAKAPTTSRLLSVLVRGP